MSSSLYLSIYRWKFLDIHLWTIVCELPCILVFRVDVCSLRILSLTWPAVQSQLNGGVRRRTRMRDGDLFMMENRKIALTFGQFASFLQDKTAMMSQMNSVHQI